MAHEVLRFAMRISLDKELILPTRDSTAEKRGGNLLKVGRTKSWLLGCDEKDNRRGRVIMSAPFGIVAGMDSPGFL